MILTCAEAKVALDSGWQVGDPAPQAVRDFLNDFGLPLQREPDRSIEEPPPNVGLTVLQPLRIYYVEETPEGLALRAETCDDERAKFLDSMDAGLGRASVRAQLWAAHKRDPNMVKREN